MVSLLIGLLSIVLQGKVAIPLHDDGPLLAPISSKELVKDILLISLVIMSALRSLFLIGKEFIMTELTISLSWILLGFLWGIFIPLKNLAKDGICLMAPIKGMVMVTFLKASS